jgi:hypothetical protein
MVAGELVASLVTVTLPVKVPVAEGEKVTLSVAVCAGARICPVDTPLAAYPAPEMLTFEMVTFEFPAFVNVTLSVLVLPIVTLPKDKLVGLALSKTVEELTVSVAVLLVALPALLLTTTVNCAPLSDDVVAGVV